MSSQVLSAFEKASVEKADKPNAKLSVLGWY
jgi:hypothetical protein